MVGVIEGFFYVMMTWSGLIATLACLVDQSRDNDDDSLAPNSSQPHDSEDPGKWGLAQFLCKRRTSYSGSFSWGLHELIVCSFIRHLQYVLNVSYFERLLFCGVVRTWVIANQVIELCEDCDPVADRGQDSKLENEDVKISNPTRNEKVTANSGQLYKCPNCLAEFQTWHGLGRHSKSKHKRSKLLPDSTCVIQLSYVLN